jgi:hypothetical protein
MRMITFIMVLLIAMPVIILGDNTLPWYEVQDWEIEVCSKWGGTASVQQTGANAEGQSYLYATTITLQAQKTVMMSENESNSTIYEVAWYFRPLKKEQTYTIELIGDGTEQIYHASASPEKGDANYQAIESSQEYESARISYESGSLTVPVVEK